MPQLTQAVLNGQVGLLSSRQFLAGRGNAFIVNNPTFGTAVAYALKTAWSATANGLFVIQNKNAPGGANIYIDSITLKQTATAPATTVSLNLDIWSEIGFVTATSAVATITPVPLANGQGYSSTTGALVQAFSAGAATIPAAVGARTAQQQVSIPTGVTILGDVFEFDFGSDGPSAGTNGLTAARAATPARMTAQGEPIVVVPGTTTIINAWWTGAATNIPSFEYAMPYFEL